MSHLSISDLRREDELSRDETSRVVGGLTLASSPHGLHYAVAHPNDPWSQAFAAQFGPGWQNYLIQNY
jgi:hypothetical protein